MDHGNRTDSAVICQNISFHIQDLASGCFDITFPLMKIICFLDIIIRLDTHKINKSCRQPNKKQDTACKNHPDLFPVKNHCPDHKKSLSEIVTVIYDVPLRGYSDSLFQTSFFIGQAIALHIVIVLCILL